MCEFPNEAVIPFNLACYFCQLGDLGSAKEYLKRAFEIDRNWRLQALEDEDFKAFVGLVIGNESSEVSLLFV